MKGGVNYSDFGDLTKNKFYNLFIWIVPDSDRSDSVAPAYKIMDEINQKIRPIKNEKLGRTLNQQEAQEIIKNYIIANVEEDKTHLSAIQVMLPTYTPPPEEVYTEETISSNLVKAYNEAMKDPSTWWRNEDKVKALELPKIFNS
jgi:hypothetical protein